ncbi:carbohydrate-binding family 9-like protein [Sandarakinorhabdus sp.]|uniref:carbohydrate-binding family 9-like protein n=1 Tax=Sandarakinorhabdus sp. TaxID=1916663 RepID=UPI003342D042
MDCIARRIAGDLVVDGDLGKPAWATAAWSDSFVDMATGAPGLFETRTAILWNDRNLYIAFQVEEPFVEARLTTRDSIIFTENDLELLIDGGDCYYELEVNAANTVYEVFFIWRDAFTRGSRFDTAQFDLYDANTYSFGGDYDRSGPTFWRGTHPRGVRWAFTGFDMPGLQTAVQVQGTLNDNSDRDSGWSLEIAIPWASLALLADGRQLPPADGDIWRMFLGRFQKLLLSGGEVMPHPAWALNSHGVYDTHQPEKWSRVRFDAGEG